jgi:peptidoglycan/LPS O-acetylase OafA/YrhL
VTAPVPRHFDSLQVLRGVAASLVLLYHATGQGFERLMHVPNDQGVFQFGAAGVDIFFPISGFIIYLSAVQLSARAGAWQVFAVRRLIRVVPLYWLVSAVKLALVLALPAVALHTTLQPSHVLASFLFFPTYDGEGHLLPILQQGWTLTFEMAFYALITLLLFLRGAVLRPAVAVLVLVGIAGFIAGPTRIWAPIDFLLDPLLLEFVGGMLMGHAVAKGFRPPPLLGVVLIAIAVCILLVSNDQAVEMNHHLRVPRWGVAGFCLLAGFLALERFFAAKRVRLLSLLGDASYSTYLIHTLVVPTVATVMAKLGLHDIRGVTLCVVLSLIAGSAAGIVLHLLVEKPLTRYLNRQWDGKPVPAATLGS